jgi:hypothetical protein
MNKERNILVLVSAVALVDVDGRVLLAQRPKASIWQVCGNFQAVRSMRVRRRRKR